MPRLRLLLNIGTADAKKLGLDFDKAKEGAVVSVSPEVGDELLKRGWAADPASGGPAPGATPTTSATPKVGEAQAGGGESTDLDSMTKAELMDYAAGRGIDLTHDMRKDEMIAAIEDAETRP